MRLATIRSGEIEAIHDVAVVVTDGRGRVIDATGDTTFGFYYRSAVKPFQATISLEAGAALTAEQTAIACSSHGGFPVHQALVEANLASAGLAADALRCPRAWPRDALAKELMLLEGHRSPTRVFNNCSGKHSAWLAGAVAAGYPTDTYLEPTHPLQQEAGSLIAEVTGVGGDPIGVDGCGAPTLRGNLPGLARAFGLLSVEPRFSQAATAMQRFPALLSSNTLNEGRFAAWWGGPVKGGAQGLIAAGRHGIGVAAKSYEGNVEIAIAAMVAIMTRSGLLSRAAIDSLGDVAHIPVLGGGRQVGTITPIED